MSDYKPEDEREVIDIQDASPEEIDAYIGDLKAKIERLQVLMDEIVAIAARR